MKLIGDSDDAAVLIEAPLPEDPALAFTVSDLLPGPGQDTAAASRAIIERMKGSVA